MHSLLRRALEALEYVDTSTKDVVPGYAVRAEIREEIRKALNPAAPATMFSLGANGFPLALNLRDLDIKNALNGDLCGEICRLSIASRDDEITRRLLEAGPGNAAGYRLKETAPSYVPQLGAPDRVEMEWEFVLIPLDEDGQLPEAPINGWTYVTLREWPE